MNTVIKLADYRKTVTGDGETLKITKKVAVDIHPDPERLVRIKESLNKINILMDKLREQSNAKD